MFRTAKVINNNDENKQGKVQVRIYPELIDVDEEFLPWVDFYSNSLNGTSLDCGEHVFPEIDSWVRVFIEDYPIFHRVKIVSNDYVEGLYIYSKSDGLKEISELDEQDYPQPIFKFYKDGTIQFHNTKTGESGTLYGDGSYQIKDKNANFFSYSKKEQKFYNDNGYIKLTNDGYVDLNGGDRTLVTFKELNTALNNFKTSIEEKIASHTHTTTCKAGEGSTTTTIYDPSSLDISKSEAKKIRTVAPISPPTPQQ
jgi:hypothetical protein